jgi:hypothetical protein
VLHDLNQFKGAIKIVLGSVLYSFVKVSNISFGEDTVVQAF